MLEKTIIAYYATRGGYIFEPGIRVPSDKLDEYVNGIKRAGDDVIPLSLDEDFELIRKAFFGPRYWECRTWEDEFCEKPPKYAPQTFGQASTPNLLLDEK